MDVVEQRRLDFSVLGPVRVAGPDGPIALGGPRVRALLLRLLIEANEPVAVGRLVHDIWEGDAPAAAPATLQTYVSRLRQAIGAPRIHSRHGGYRLEVAPDELDAALFERELREGSGLWASRDAAAAVEVLERALRRWRGDPLPEVAGAVWALAEVTRLTELHGHGWEQWCEARLALGQHQQVVPAAEAVVARDPLRETMWRHLMLALYRDGRQADALRAFRRLTEALGELGLEPGREARALEEAILLQKAELDWPGLEAAGRVAVTPATRSRPAPATSGDSAPPPMPAAIGVARRGRFVGRDDEGRRLSEAWNVAQKGRLRVVVVTGEAGIGKTRLAAEFANQVYRHGGVVLWGRCDEESSAYQPFAEMLSEYLGSCPASTLAGVLGADGPEVVRLVPTLVDRVPDLTPPAIVDLEANRDRLLEALVGVLRRAAEMQPMLMIVDDLHAAPRDTLTLMRHLARKLSTSPVLIAVTYRDTDVSDDHPLHDLRAYLAIDDLLEPMHLVGLDSESLGQLAAGEGASTPAAGDLRARTGGNPFFCLQLVRDLGESTTAAGPPSGVRDVVRQRVDRLGAPARHVLQLAAVAGMVFDADLLDQLTVGPAEPGDIVVALERAVAARLLDEVPSRPGQFRFVHALVQETLYAAVSAVRRAALHRRIAHVLAARHRPATAVAHHMALGASVDTITEVVSWLRRAAAELIGVLAFDDAADTLYRALDLLETWAPEDRATRASLRLSLAFFLGVRGDVTGQKRYAAMAADDARAVGSVAMLADAAIERATWTEAGVADAGARRLLVEALAAAGTGHPALRSTLLAATGMHHGLTGAGAAEMDPMFAEAEALARTQGDPALLFEVLHFRAVLLQGAPALEEQRRIVAEMEAIERKQGQALWERPSTHWARMKLLLGVRDFLGWWDMSGLLRFRAVVALQGGDLDAFDRDLEVAAESWSSRSRSMAATVAMWRGLRDLLDGRYEDAARHADEMIQTAGDERNFANSWAGMQFQIARERGTLAELRPLLESTIAESPDIVAFRTGLAVLLTDAGDLDAAASSVASLGPDLSQMLGAVGGAVVLAQLAEVVGRLGDRTRAEQLQELLAPYQGQLIVVSWGVFVVGAADRFRGMLAATVGAWEEADKLFKAALDLEESIGAAPLAVRTRLAWARGQVARGRRHDLDAARLLVQQAEADAARLGMAGVVAEINDLRGHLAR